VRPATTILLGGVRPGECLNSTSSSTPWTVRLPGCLAQPEKSVPS